jgi:molybdenum-dependent DNA-binding transcriptional regulator ModE
MRWRGAHDSYFRRILAILPVLSSSSTVVSGWTKRPSADLLVFLEEGSLDRAAARLRISQPALSRQMQALEHELGGRLLERMATGVSPTAGGQALANRMGAVLASYDLAMSDTCRALRGETDELRSVLQKVREVSPEI